MYLTYEEYKQYGGTLDEPTFNQLSFKCQKMIDAMTAERVKKMKEFPEAVKRCMFELMNQEEIFSKNMTDLVGGSSSSNGKVIASFSTDGYQESYGGGSDNTGSYLRKMREDLDSLQKTTISDMLAYERDDNNTKLLYRGVV